MKEEKIIIEIENLLLELRRSLNLARAKNVLTNSQPNKNQRAFQGLTGKIHALVEEGFFDEPKIIAELQKKLRDEGTKKPTTSLMPSLLLLVQKKILKRNKLDKGPYKYYKG